MRQLIDFDCEGATLAATLDAAAGRSGLLIVSGGNEIRAGAHRGMARLAADIATAGHPVLRFDRRGIGDSHGENQGFEASGPDIAAAIAAFRAACPTLERIIAYGNCDAATALLLHKPRVEALVLSNPWLIEPHDDLPPPAAIRARYWQRLRDPAAWRRLLSGAVNLRKLASGLLRIAVPARPSTLVTRVADALAKVEAPVSILIASGDATAIAFADAWRQSGFAAARERISLTLIDSDSHSFARDDDYAALMAMLKRALD